MGKDQVIPQVKEQETVDVGQDVGRARFLRDDLIYAGTVGATTGRRTAQYGRRLLPVRGP
jgi:hypothetical protein